MRGLILFAAALCGPVAANAQLFDVYSDTTVADVYITIDPARLDSLWTRDPYSDYEYLCKVKMVQNGQADSVMNAGFRFRGNTSRVSRKKSFKVSINTFTKGQRLLGYKDFNLNGEHNDPSLIRAKLVWDLFNAAGLPATRARHVRLWVNGGYYGVYLSVEHVNDDFLQRRFGNQSGNLYKCLYPADLTYRSEDPDAYKFLRDGRERTYDLKTNEEADDYRDLAGFISFLNRSSDAEFAGRIEERFNVDGFLRYLAVCVLTGNWDSYWYLKNNFYLYNNPASGRFEFLPYDVDNTLGVDWIGRDWATRGLYAWGHESEPRPLATRILAVADYRNRFSQYIETYRNNLIHPDSLARKAPVLQQRIRSAVAADPFYPLDYRYSIDSFDQSVFSAQGGHVKAGIVPFAATRRLEAGNQVVKAPFNPFVRDLDLPVALAGRPYPVRFQAGSEAPVDSVLLEVRSGGTSVWIKLQQASGGWYSGQVPAQAGVHQLRVLLYGPGGATGGWPSVSSLFRHSVTPVEVSDRYPLRLNEFLADNAAGGFADEAGDLEDWIELQNPGDASLRLGGYFLTDNLAMPSKWAFPDVTLAAGAYAVVFADEEAAEGPLHAAFKLSRGGEAIGLFYKEGDRFVLVDSVKFGAQATGISSGRQPDATGAWFPLNPPTPGRSNGIPSAAGRDIATGDLSITAYPNPFNGSTSVQVTLARPAGVTIRLYDIQGRELMALADRPLAAGSHRFVIRSEGLASGVYLVRLQTAGETRLQRITVLK